jgi:hypothetical protein
MPCAKEEALAIGRTSMSLGPTLRADQAAAEILGARAWIGPAGIVARSLTMVALAAFAILVLLPAAVAAQASISV